MSGKARRALLAGAPCALLLGLALSCADTSSGRAAAASAARRDDSIDVELDRGSALPPLACDGPFRVLDAHGRAVGEGPRLAADTAVDVTRTQVRIGTIDAGPPPVDVVPDSGAGITVAGKPYRGVLRLDWDRASGKPLVLNHVSLEDYLLGVVPGEMPERFGLEALKAQAVAARSYALAESAGTGRIYDDTRSQVYGGRGIESALASRAVHETRGEVLTDGQEVIEAYYHSTCGGRTTPALTVFPTAPASVMNRAVTCPDCRNSPTFSWLRRFSAERVCAAADLPVAPLVSADVEPETIPGRPETIRLRAGEREATLPLVKFRERISAGRPKDEQMLSTLLSALPRLEQGQLVIEGHGWGHGVGLCQYGAAGFAARGATYNAILARYYPGAVLTSRDATVKP